ncbi:hypothetical protein [Maritimibacter sp. DP1N21-5]|uniref:hypothetical protein n=1 Tax=Maritimibacter sp. DP1N21-5 TaxID=2836867 RepID=UPI001C44F673|nr:hypothetical protein [Maritimibacter sp. DP1N21-5]MBV7407442.1 hypothetical protein [Maritimibacter sp. DP1N21-5]
MEEFTIPEGQFALTAEMDDRLRQMAGAGPRAGDGAHPIFALVGALGGLGLRIAELSRALGLDFDAGPVLARCRLDYDDRLRVGTTYRVAARVDEITRKPSRVFGQADHLHLSIMLHDDRPVSRARLHIVFPVRTP